MLVKRNLVLDLVGGVSKILSMVLLVVVVAVLVLSAKRE